jgi:hypothetical protein
MMPKKITYYASEIQNNVKMKKGIAGLQVGLLNYLIRAE